MVDYRSWSIIVSYMIAIRSTTSEELCSQSITILKIHNGWTNEWTNGEPKIYMPQYCRIRDIKIRIQHTMKYFPG